VAVKRGESAVVVPVPAAEPLVSRRRERLDPSAAAGMPAHITLLYPFLPEQSLNQDALNDLRKLCAGFKPLEVTFKTTARFPDVVYLAPEPDRPLQDMTLAIARRWPGFPPYAGQFEEIVPHLTVAIGRTEILDAVEAELRRHLPVSAMVDQAQLLTFDGSRWHPRMRLPFS
jgi:2'-5' RNA ligase